MAAVSCSFVMCKKGESGESNVANFENTMDSVTLNNTKEAAASIELDTTSQTISKIPESVNEKIRNQKIVETDTKKIDSIKESIAKTEVKAEKMIFDTVKKTEKPIQINMQPTTIKKETKIVYRELPKVTPKQKEISTNPVKKSGSVEIGVDDMNAAKSIAVYEIGKYDGTIISENVQSNDDMQLVYYKISVPLQKFDYLVEGLENIGTLENKNLETTGANFSKNTMCSLEITLYNKNKNLSAAGIENKGFGNRTINAIASGWNVLENIFLFLLPSWPLFLIGTGIYFYYKNRKIGKITKD